MKTYLNAVRVSASGRSFKLWSTLSLALALATAATLLLARPAITHAQAAAPAGSTGGPIKIGVAAPSRIFNDMLETKALQDKMKQDGQKFETAVNQKKAGIEQIRLSRDALNPSHPQYEELNSQLIEESVKMKVWMEAERAKAEYAQKKQMKMLFEKIQNAIGEVAKQDGLDLVVADNKDPLPSDADLEQVDIRALRGAILQKSVLFSNDRIDISQKVLALLDTRYKAAGGAVVIPAPAAPAASPGAVGAPSAVAPPRSANR